MNTLSLIKKLVLLPIIVLALFLSPLLRANPGYDANASFFYDALAPYGTWVNHPIYGQVWYPRNIARNWRPYTNGHWTYTIEYGWLWQANEPWGWAVFHYGRWAWDDWYGWLWVPGRTWAPAWVFWRSGGGYVGWTPMPPNVVWQPDTGLNFQYFDYNRDLHWDSWVMVREYKLPDHNIMPIYYPASQNRSIIEQTHIVNQSNTFHTRNVINNRQTVTNNILVNKGPELGSHPVPVAAPPITIPNTVTGIDIQTTKTNPAGINGTAENKNTTIKPGMDNNVPGTSPTQIAPPTPEEIKHEEELAKKFAEKNAEKQKTDAAPALDLAKPDHQLPRVPQHFEGKEPPTQAPFATPDALNPAPTGLPSDEPVPSTPKSPLVSEITPKTEQLPQNTPQISEKAIKQPDKGLVVPLLNDTQSRQQGSIPPVTTQQPTSVTPFQPFHFPPAETVQEPAKLTPSEPSSIQKPTPGQQPLQEPAPVQQVIPESTLAPQLVQKPIPAQQPAPATTSVQQTVQEPASIQQPVPEPAPAPQIAPAPVQQPVPEPQFVQEPAPVQQSAPVAGSVPQAAQESSPVQQSAPALQPVQEPVPVQQSAPVAASVPQAAQESAPVQQLVPESAPAPQLVQQPAPPVQQSVPESAPVPQPVQQPAPVPVQQPVPEPTPAPQLVQEPPPVQQSVPEPTPVPQPVQQPVPEPTPAPQLVQEPPPVQQSVPEPTPVPQPVQQPAPAPVQQPVPEPAPAPLPVQQPAPATTVPTPLEKPKCDAADQSTCNIPSN